MQRYHRWHVARVSTSVYLYPSQLLVHGVQVQACAPPHTKPVGVTTKTRCTELKLLDATSVLTLGSFCFQAIFVARILK
eukprot:1649672-Amphidinium_carterae.1